MLYCCMFYLVKWLAELFLMLSSCCSATCLIPSLAKLEKPFSESVFFKSTFDEKQFVFD